ncbi:MAG TPA: hypothetical protein HPP80_06800 [Rhodospirillaceae bacterium]|nr:hypothetical protein [Rhodospirillaceae bacterium]
MWWPKRQGCGGAGFIFLSLILLTGCGFRPLYGKNSYDPAILDELASITVQTLPDRQGQLLHNALLTNLTPRGEASMPRYVLRLLPQTTEVQQALRTDDTATRNAVFYNLRYFLYEGQTALTAGVIAETYSYDYLSEHYANIAAQEDVQRRAAAAIADELRNRLAEYFVKAYLVKSAK